MKACKGCSGSKELNHKDCYFHNDGQRLIACLVVRSQVLKKNSFFLVVAHFPSCFSKPLIHPTQCILIKKSVGIIKKAFEKQEGK